MPWLSDHFIQLIIRPDHESVFSDFYDHADLDNFFCMLFTLPGLHWMRTNWDAGFFTVFSDYIEHMIQKGYALEACLDRYYFKFSSLYNSTHYIHSTLIYGFDTEKREIYVADFWDNGKYDQKVVSYDEINASLNNNWLINIFSLEDGQYTFNPVLMKQSFEDYLHSEDSFHKFVFSGRAYNKTAIFGLKYYDYLMDRLNRQDNTKIDFRLFHILYDHKVLMSHRLKYLESINFRDAQILASLKEKNEKLTRHSLILRNRVLKYNLNSSATLLDQIKISVTELKTLDREFTEAVLAMIDIHVL